MPLLLELPLPGSREMRREVNRTGATKVPALVIRHQYEVMVSGARCRDGGRLLFRMGQPDAFKFARRSSYVETGSRSMPDEAKLDRYQAVVPYLIVTGAGAFIDFVKKAFGGTERMRSQGANGAIMHAEVQIGDSVIMLADALDETHIRTAMLHLYVADVDAEYARVLRAGGESIRTPADQAYGDRTAATKDRWGNEWWLATHIVSSAPA